MLCGKKLIIGLLIHQRGMLFVKLTIKKIETEKFLKGDIPVLFLAHFVTRSD